MLSALCANSPITCGVQMGDIKVEKVPIFIS
jgi:hypothetical protein